jgi:hypothetical protein
MGTMMLARLITITPVSFVVGIAAALLGFVEVIFLDRLVYPAVRRAHERKKLTGTHRTDPAVVMQLVKFQGLVVLPILGFLFGEHFFGDYVRSMLAASQGE